MALFYGGGEATPPKLLPGRAARMQQLTRDTEDACQKKIRSEVQLNEAAERSYYDTET